MKTKILKSVLPALAILMAVGFAFATEVDSTSRIAYYEHPLLGVQSVMVGSECNINGEIDCTFNGQQLYAEPTLQIELRKNK